MTYTEKRLEEFDSKYIKGDFGITTCDPHVVPLKSLKDFIATSIAQAIAEERERMRGEIEVRMIGQNVIFNLVSRGELEEAQKCNQSNHTLADLLTSLDINK